MTGFTEENPPHFSSGEIIPQMDEPRIGHMVVKCGAVTGLTHGHLALDGSIFRMENQEMQMPGIAAQRSPRIVMYRQYLVEPLANHPFFEIGDSGSLVFMHHGRDLKCIGMAIGNTSYGGCIVTPIEAILEAFQNDYHFDDPPFYPFDSRRDDDDFDDGSSDDNDGDDENGGFDHYQNRLQRINRDNHRSNKLFNDDRASALYHHTFNTRKVYEGSRKRRLRNRGSMTSQFARIYSEPMDSKNKIRSPSSSKRKTDNCQRAGAVLTSSYVVIGDSDSNLYKTDKGLHRRLQTKSGNDITNESDGNTGCENDFVTFISDKNISDIEGIGKIDKNVLEIKDKKEKNPRGIPGRAEILNREVRLQSEVQYRSLTTTLNVTGDKHAVFSSDSGITIVPRGELQSITSQLLASVERNKEFVQKIIPNTKQTNFTIRVTNLQIFLSFIFSFLKLSLGSDQGILATNYAEVFNTFTKTEKDT